MPVFDEFPSLTGGAMQIDPHDIAEALRLMSRVYTGMEAYTPRHYRLEVIGEAGELETIEVDDTPLNRMLLALKEWYHEETAEQYLSLCWRLLSLSKLIREGALDDWIGMDPDDGALTINGAVIRAAAELPLWDIEGFDRDIFLNTVDYLNQEG